jgi:hypothetical protein
MKQLFTNESGFTDEEIIRELLQFKKTAYDLKGGKMTVAFINDYGNIEITEESLTVNRRG